ncbi:protein arginine N-methyltransferase 7 [Sitophilus oryzae]|uniref:Protein arginine N-methyltransferase n=1 Tax=Sitophilus oryzae TaxID=7048 RepID=A0A6J2XMK9_SITOR|nr:protein arginine N-methyltransferase 7 [Sitophilus oryzae]
MIFSQISRKILLKPNIKNTCKMSIFVQKLNPLTGNNDWVIQNEEYDYHQEVARSAFADMLHDTERNQLYENALISAINEIHSRGKKAKVLDIGTGTGLLSMMAARNGADSIVACEAFKPMSECAVKVIESNGFKDKINVIPKRSTDLSVGPEGDLKEKCNILVTEVFDTELIGEGALSTFSHAHKHLLENDCIVVPESATVYAQVVECPLAQNWNKLKDFYNDDLEILLKIPDLIKTCPGSSAVHDIQLSQLPLSSFNSIVPPIPVLRFDWSGKTPFVFTRSTIQSLKAVSHGKAQMVFMWWDLQMDIEGKHILSCAPYWAHPKSKEKITVDIPWRDHWIQAIYYFPEEVRVEKDQEIHLISCHDEYSLWFNLRTDLKLTDIHYLNPICECGLHVAFSRTRIGQINDMKRNKKYLRLFENHIDKNSVLLFLSEGFYYGLVAAKLGAKHLYFLETNILSKRVLESIIKFNNINNVTILKSIDDLKLIDLKDVTVIFGEPYFTSSILPWDNLLFFYLSDNVRTLLNREVEIYPRKCLIKGMAVKFDHLHKIRAPLISCEGFLMKHFDDLILESSNISDDNVEAQPLWEYPCIAVSDEITLAEVNLANGGNINLESTHTFSIQNGLSCNGVTFWVEWCIDGSPKSTISTGPVHPVSVGKSVEWDKYTRQGVYLLPSSTLENINCRFCIDLNEGSIKFKFL